MSVHCCGNNLVTIIILDLALYVLRIYFAGVVY